MSAERPEYARGVFSCPRCGVRQHPILRDPDGGMWMHLKCKHCGCKFDYKTLTEAERRAKHAEEQRRYREAHPERVRESKRRAVAKRPEHYAAKKAEWKRDNPDKVRESQRRYRASHPEQVRAAAARYRERHREDINLRRNQRNLFEREHDMPTMIPRLAACLPPCGCSCSLAR